MIKMAGLIFKLIIGGLSMFGLIQLLKMLF